MIYAINSQETHNFHLVVHRCIDNENASHGVTSFQLFALHFHRRCEVRKMRGRKNAKSTKCIAQHIPTQLRSFSTKIFLVNLRRKHALAFCTRFEHVRYECRQRIEAIKMRYRRLRLKTYTGLNLTEKKRKAFEKFRVRI